MNVITDGEKEMSDLKVDSKKKSASEALVNSFGGYPIGYAVGILILPKEYLENAHIKINN